MIKASFKRLLRIEGNFNLQDRDGFSREHNSFAFSQMCERPFKVKNTFSLATRC